MSERPAEKDSVSTMYSGSCTASNNKQSTLHIAPGRDHGDIVDTVNSGGEAAVGTKKLVGVACAHRKGKGPWGSLSKPGCQQS